MNAFVKRWYRRDMEIRIFTKRPMKAQIDYLKIEMAS